MNFAKVMQAIKAPRAVLACLAWACLLSAGQSEEALLPNIRQNQVVAASQSSLGEPDAPEVEPIEPGRPAEQAGPVLGPGLEPPGAGINISDAPANSTGWSAADAAQPAAPVWSRMWRWVPQGMIPFGPRTPDSEKDRGIGQPLPGRGWRNQPFQISVFSGATNGSALIPGHLHQRPSYYGGINLGWDFDHYWGIEKRLGFGALNLTDGNNQPIPQTGLSVTGEYRLMYYPLGDARWRPFLTAGVGWSDFYFMDDHGNNHLDTVGMIPFGGGLKYLCNERLAIRIDLIDEMTFGGGALSNFHYVALTAGLEFRYGRRLINMPWHRIKDGT